MYEGNTKLILGLLWALILRYQIAGVGGSDDSKKQKEAQKKRLNAKKLLLGYVNAALPDHDVSNFTTSWNDGLKLSALVDSCQPGLIPDHASLNPDNALENITKAMDIAEKELNVPQVMHPEDLAVEKPDELSVMTYISGFCRPSSGGNQALLDWINSKIPNQPVSNFTSDWVDGLSLGALTDSVSEGDFPDSEQMRADDAYKNCLESMDAAESILGVSKTVPPDEFADADLDQLSRMTYLTQFRHAKPTGKRMNSTLKAVGPGITGDSAEKETNFLVRGPRIPKWSKLDVTVSAPDGDQLPFKKTITSGKATSFQYTPPTPGNYKVDIKFNDEPIPGSPFHVTHRPPSNVDGCVASGSGLEKSRVGETSSFGVNCEQGGPGELLVEVEGPSGNVGVEMQESSDRNYDVSFTPLEPGEHTISVLWDDKPIPGSPFTCSVSDPKKCMASGSGLTKASIEKPQQFQVKTDKAGPGTLTADVKGPGGEDIPIEISEDSGTCFTCTYVPNNKGPHMINVNWCDAPIAGSPFKVNVTAPADSSKCKVNNLPEGRLRAGKTYSFTVDASDAGSGEVKAAAHGPSVPEKCSVKETGVDQFEVSFTPAEIGPLKVETSYADSPIPDTPFQFTVNDPTKVRVNRSAIENGSYQVKQPIDFRVAAQHAGVGDIAASVKGPKGNEDVEIQDQGDKTYLMHYMPSEGGHHAISIKFDGDDIPDVPIRIFVEEGVKADNVVVTQPAPSKIGVYLIEHPYDYKVNTAGAGEDVLTATSHGARTGAVPKIEVIGQGNGRHAVSIEAEQPDEYLVSIKWGEDHVPGSPFKLAIEDKPRPENVICTGPNYELGSLDPITLDVNTEHAGAGKLESTCYGKDLGAVPVDVTEKEPKKYLLSVTPPKLDDFSISVLWSSTAVKNSPFKVNIIPPDASKCVITGPDIPMDPSQPVVFHVNATNAGNGHLEASAVGDNSGETDTEIKEVQPCKFDVSYFPAPNESYNVTMLWAGKPVPESPFRVESQTANAEKVFICEPPTAMLEAGQAISICFDTSKAGLGKLTADCKGNRLGEVPIMVRQRAIDKKKYDVRFVPPEPDVYVVSVMWAGKYIKGSPYTINLMPVDVNKIRVIGPSMPEGLEGPVEVMLQTAGAGNGKVTGNCVGKKSGNVTVAVKETSSDIYQLTFKPPQADMYMLAIQYGGQKINGSPFTVNTYPADCANVRVTEPFSVAVSEPVHYKIDASEAGHGKLKTTCRGEKYGQIQLDVFDDGAAQYDASFTPHHSDLYFVTIEWDDKEVPYSPFRVDLRPPMAERVKVGELHIPKEAGTGDEVWLDIDCTEAGHGPIMAEVRGDHVGKVSVDADQLALAKYRVKFPPKQADIYHFAVAYGENQIPGSPFFINLIPPQADLVKHIGTTVPANYEVGGPVVLTFDTSQAGNGMMSADIAGEESGAVPAKVEKISQDKVKVTFIPKEPEIYNAVILWSGKTIKNSPVKVDTRPTLHPEFVRCSTPVYTEINEPAYLTVDVRKAGPGKVAAKCLDDSLAQIPTEVQKVSPPGVYKVSFLPKAHAVYNLSIFFEGDEVLGSPFPVNMNLVDEMADMALMTAVEESIHIPEEFLQSAAPMENGRAEEPEQGNELTSYVGQPLNLTVDAEDKEKRNGKLAVAILGAETGKASADISKNKDGTFNVNFNPTQPDRYTVEVLLDDEHIPGSPFVITYLPPIDSSKCRIFGLQDIPRVPQVNEPIKFGVDSKNAGGGKLGVSSDGPSMKDHPSVLEVSEDEPGIHNITYIPTDVGQHRVHLLWSGDKVPGSPLVFEVGDTSRLQTFPFGKPVSMDFSADCKAGDLDSHAIHEETEVKYKVKVSKHQKGKFKMGFQPKQPGIYAVHILLKKKESPGSPYRIRVLPPPKPEAVKIEGLNGSAFVDFPITFNVDATSAGGGDLGVRVSGPKNVKDADLSVTPSKTEGLYAVKYTPRVKGGHQFNVTWAGKVIPGSPFPVNVMERKPEVKMALRANATNLVQVGQSANVMMVNLSPDLDEDYVTAKCTGEKCGNVEVPVEKGEDGSYVARFTPTVADDYDLEVKMNKKEISGSPFSIKAVDKGVLSPSYDHPEGPAHSKVQAGKPVNIIAETSGALGDPSDLSVTSVGPYGPCESLAPNTDLEGAVGLGFLPPLSGDYLVTAKKDGADVAGSPFKVTAIGKDPDPSKVCILDDDMSVFNKVIPFGRSAKFRVSTTDAGPGTLNITSRGPGKAQVKVFDNKDGTYTCEFTPSIAGKYHIDVLWNNDHIQGSPYLLTFKSKKSRVITGLDLENENFRIGVPHRFKLHCDEVGDGVLEILCKPPSAAAVRLIPIASSSSYQCEIHPKEIGNHEIHVLYSGKHILGSPFHVHFELRGDASKVRMVESNIERQPELGDKVSFVISTEGAGKGKLTSSVENAASKERLPVSVTPTSDNHYNVEFTPTDDAEYLLTVKYDDVHISGSPFKLVFGPPESDASKCTSSGDGLLASIVDKPAKFIVDTVEAGPGELNVAIEGASGALQPKINPVGDTQMEVTYQTTMPGKHTVFVRWSDKDIPGSPFTVQAYNASDPGLLKVDNPVAETFLGTPIEFTVQAQGETDAGELTVVALNAQNNALPGNVERCDDGRTYNCLLEPSATGKYMVHVKWNGADVKGSPFKTRVLTPPKPANIKAYGPGLEDGCVGQEGTFTVETAEGGSGTLQVRVHGPKGAFKIHMRRHPDNNRTILVRYDPTHAGKYNIDITWSDMPIPGSPFTVNVTDQ